MAAMHEETAKRLEALQARQQSSRAAADAGRRPRRRHPARRTPPGPRERPPPGRPPPGAPPSAAPRPPPPPPPRRPRRLTGAAGVLGLTVISGAITHSATVAVAGQDAGSTAATNTSAAPT